MATSSKDVASDADGVAVFESARLKLRRLLDDDAAFILRLLNEPSWLQYIGDRGVRTLDQARDYIRNGPQQMYVTSGFGLFVVESRTAPVVPMGLCGLLRRSNLPDVDIGFALLPEFWGHGYAHEAAAATLRYGRDVHGLARIAAITLPTNASSRRLLGKLGMVCERTVRLAPDGEELLYYATGAADAPAS
jgi:RimJ/RimL family protein N-acetyltransferase